MPGVLPGLGLCVWIVYVLDRVMDGVGESISGMDRRHAFHHRWRWMLLGLVAVASGWAGWLALVVVPSGLTWQCVSLGLMMMLYLIIFPAAGGGRFRWLIMPLTCLGLLALARTLPISPILQLLLMALSAAVWGLLAFKGLHQWLASALSKDVAGGLLFALGCTAWNRFIQEGGDVLSGSLELVLLSLLFIGNLTGISSRGSQERWLALGFGTVGGVLIMAVLGRVVGSIGTLALAVGLGLVLLTLLNKRRSCLSEEAYRVWADVAVLVPMLGVCFGA
jgi:hypothetical protein